MAPLPLLFISHGPGPCWLLDKSELSGPLKAFNNKSPPADALKTLIKDHNIPKPSAILVISAHYEEKEHEVMIGEEPPLYYDYYGFPDKAYKVKWPVKGHPEVAKKVKQCLEKAAIKCNTNYNRGIDHGVFVPLSLMYPNADIPIVQVSQKTNMKIEDHMKLGEALSDLRNEDIMIIGSGHTTHNALMNGSGVQPDWVKAFMSEFNDMMTNKTYTPEQRRNMLLTSEKMTSFKSAHPRNDHYLPAVVVAAASGYNAGNIMYEECIGESLVISHLRFD